MNAKPMFAAWTGTTVTLFKWQLIDSNQQSVHERPASHGALRNELFPEVYYYQSFPKHYISK